MGRTESNGVSRMKNQTKLFAVGAMLVFTIHANPALASEDSMSAGEMDEVFDDLGHSGSGEGETKTASIPSDSSMSSPPVNDFSSRASDLDDEKDDDGAVDKEMSENGGGEGWYGGGATPEPDYNASDLNRTTPVPGGDHYNQDYAKPAKKKAQKSSKSKKKHKVAKKSKSKKKIAKHSSKKKKDRGLAGRKSSNKKRYR